SGTTLEKGAEDPQLARGIPNSHSTQQVNRLPKVSILSDELSLSMRPARCDSIAIVAEGGHF
ncbi:MAG TPA: hypothetical protein VH230_04205, partial [Stellaceae bacterium]|nr:hypothetical protein [Stellaceae bacterium]